MRSLLAPHALWKALLVLTLGVCALPAVAQATPQTKTKTKTQTKAKSKPKGSKKTPAPAPAPDPESPKAPDPAPPKAPAAEKAKEPDKAPAKAVAPAKPPAPVKPPVPEKVLPQSQVQAQERAEASSRMRIGVGLDLFTEKARMSGEQTINTSRQDESFDYNSSSFLSATLSLSVPAPIAKERARIGGGVRLFGNYSAGDRQFGFGLLNQAFVTGEYGLPVADKTEVVFGARAGLSLLFPGHELDKEIHRLQVQGVDVWGVPRVGWVVGLSAGGRRRMSEHILLRADLSGQLEKLYLFATSQEIEGLQFDKHWSTFGLRLGLTLGIEFAL
jgi:hypothetical protein